MTTIDETGRSGDDRFDVDLIMRLADEAEQAASGDDRPTMADVAENAYQAFKIGVWEMSHDNYAQAVPWLSAAVHSGIEEARPLLAICVETTDAVEARRVALQDEREGRLAGDLTVPDGSVTAYGLSLDPATPIYDAVVASAVGSWATTETPPEPPPAPLPPDPGPPRRRGQRPAPAVLSPPPEPSRPRRGRHRVDPAAEPDHAVVAGDLLDQRPGKHAMIDSE